MAANAAAMGGEKLAVSHRDTEASEAEEKNGRVGSCPIQTPSSLPPSVFSVLSVWTS
jgi:hypothetical protein